MKKLVILIAMLFGVVSGASAQEEIFESTDNKVYFGARLGLDISCPTDVRYKNVNDPIDLFNPGAGFDAGAILNIPLWKNLYFEPGLSIYYNTTKIDVDVADSELPPSGEVHASIRRFGFRMPFMAGYRFDFQPVAISVFTGPVLSLPIIGREHVSVEYNRVKESDSSSCFGDEGILNRVDIGWRFGVGATYGPYIFQVSGTVGMLDMMKGPGKYRDGNVAITVGYNFGF